LDRVTFGAGVNKDDPSHPSHPSSSSVPSLCCHNLLPLPPSLHHCHHFYQLLSPSIKPQDTQCGMVKDRLEELRRKAAQATNGRSVDVEKSSHKGSSKDREAANRDVEAANEKTSLLDPFFSEVERVQEQLTGLKEDIERVEKIHSFLLNGKEPDKKVIQEQTNQLDHLNNQMRKTSLAVKNKLRELNDHNNSVKGKNGPTKESLSPTELRIRETQLSFLHKLFVNLMTDHSTSQADYNERHKKLLRAHMEVIGINKTDQEFERMMGDGWATDLFTEGLLRQTADAKQALAEVNARHEIIVQIEKSIQEVHDLFLQMATLVEEQGDLVDVIERNVARGTEAARSGREQLSQAEKSKKAAFIKKIWCYAILVVLLVILVVSAFFFP